eukprot:m.293939 g.293939  ORF g.293939 m.293939 type:complete len:485 (-) comp12893_c0_seq1:84-1538(-)
MALQGGQVAAGGVCFPLASCLLLRIPLRIQPPNKTLLSVTAHFQCCTLLVMRVFVAICVLLLLAVSPVHAELASVEACQAAYFASDRSCRAVVILSQCFAAIDDMSMELQQSANSFLEQAQMGRDCSQEMLDDPPKIGTDGGSLYISVAEGGDVKLIRHSREIVSLFDLQARIAALETSNGADMREYAHRVEAVEDKIDLMNKTIMAMGKSLDELFIGLNRNLSTAIEQTRTDTYGLIDTRTEESRAQAQELFKTLETILQKLHQTVNEQKLYPSCKAILEAGLSVGDGYYVLKSGTSVFCDMANGGWTRVFFNTFQSDHHNLDFEQSCPCTFGHDSLGWKTGISGCPGSNPLSLVINGENAFYTWRFKLQTVDIGPVSEVRHTATHHNNKGYDHQGWPAAELVSESPLNGDGEYGTALLRTDDTYQWFAKLGLGKVNVMTAKQSNVEYKAPYMTLLYSDGGPPACDRTNSDGFDILNMAVWVR